MTTDVRHNLANEFHAALTTGDWDRFRAICSPAVAWTLPGNNAISGRVEGVDAVVGRGQLIASYGVTFTLEHVLVSRDNMALSLHNTASSEHAVLDEHLATVCRLAHGKIAEIETFLSDEPGMDRFFG